MCIAHMEVDVMNTHTLRWFLSDESGATAIEYGLIASLIAVAIIGTVTELGTKLTATFGSVAASLK